MLAIEARSASLLADSIAFLEAASVGALTSFGGNWSQSGRESFAGFCGTIISIPTYALFWMIAANYYEATIPSAAPLAATGAALLLTNIACLVVRNHGRLPPLADSSSDVRNHAIMNIMIVLAALVTWVLGTMWPDAFAALGILCASAGAAEHIWAAARELPPVEE
jgi:hypothetical protein